MIGSFVGKYVAKAIKSKGLGAVRSMAQKKALMKAVAASAAARAKNKVGKAVVKRAVTKTAVRAAVKAPSKLRLAAYGVGATAASAAFEKGKQLTNKSVAVAKISGGLAIGGYALKGAAGIASTEAGILSRRVMGTSTNTTRNIARIKSYGKAYGGILKGVGTYGLRVGTAYKNKYLG